MISTCWYFFYFTNIFWPIWTFHFSPYSTITSISYTQLTLSVSSCNPNFTIIIKGNCIMLSSRYLFYICYIQFYRKQSWRSISKSHLTITVISPSINLSIICYSIHSIYTWLNIFNISQKSCSILIFYLYKRALWRSIIYTQFTITIISSHPYSTIFFQNSCIISSCSNVNYIIHIQIHRCSIVRCIT